MTVQYYPSIMLKEFAKKYNELERSGVKVKASHVFPHVSTSGAHVFKDIEDSPSMIADCLIYYEEPTSNQQQVVPEKKALKLQM